eukprot:7615165-Prorocentrum_lima.AAC.1
MYLPLLPTGVPPLPFYQPKTDSRSCHASPVGLGQPDRRWPLPGSAASSELIGSLRIYSSPSWQMR